MAGGSTSFFRMNVDGTPCISTGDIEIRGGDSMYVFVDVTIDPNNSNSPLMVEDSIIFQTNGNDQKVVLNAVGQDAYFHYRETLNCNETWTNDKPHVIYDWAIVPSCCSLTMQPGTRVYVHKNGILAVDSCASLKILGAFGNPVTVQGDRLEADYEEEPGQWGFIWLSGGSVNNVIDWAVIKNSSTGILCDTLGNSPNPTLTISNTKIRNMADYGIFGEAGTWIEGYNVQITNCADYEFAIAFGGKCKMSHCTFGNYWDITSRTSPCVVLNNAIHIDETTVVPRDLTQADFLNCIIYGPLDNEIGLDSTVIPGHQFNYLFSHCLVRTNLNVSDLNHWQNNIYNLNPAFHDVTISDMHIDAGSAARNIGDPAVGLLFPNDLDNMPRNISGNPDAGALEGQ